VLSTLVAAIGLIVATPLMLVVALLIKLTSRGPVLFTQTRVGYDRRRTQRSRRLRDCRRRGDVGGKPFKIYKFRTMYTDREAADRQVWATPDDPRITPLGRTLRKLRLDELPQLWNVLRGEMNIVGPRPEQPKIFAELRERIPRYHERQRARPGITGWAQVNQRYDQSLRDVRSKVTYDVEYVWRQSLWEDIKIMLQTIPVMLFRRGAC
jgi:lipopolysaccharide/colanic/teichoic acid biosynthesis glycosyltransferase